MRPTDIADPANYYREDTAMRLPLWMKKFTAAEFYQYRTRW
jgi:hypothetical protein